MKIRALLFVFPLVAFLFPTAPLARQQSFDLLIRGGKCLDGSGKPAVVADIGIIGDRIAFVGRAPAGATAKRTIDAAGLTVAPGFIDPHTHSLEDLANPPRNVNENYLLQGVTTVVTGNDGGGPFPLAPTMDKLEKQGIGTNAAFLVGHGTVRLRVMEMADAAPVPEQLERMKSLVNQAMDEGAFGMSTGLYYPPGSYSKTEEVIELAKVVGARGGVYDTHMRDESSYTIGLLGSIAETIRIGREAKLPVHISHIKALGKDVWGKSREAIALIRAARKTGVDVTANQYPYEASGTSVEAALVPRWAEAGGGLLARIADPAVKPKLVKEMEANLVRRGGAKSLLLISAKDKSLIGRTLEDVARATNKPPIEAALDIIKAGGAGVASFNMTEADIVEFMKQDFVMTGSDGSDGHPRKFGTYPRKLREYVFQKKVLSLPAAIRASGAHVAETFRIPDRGKLAVGQFADVIVFDEKTIADQATYTEPKRLAVGMNFVVVNGQLAVADGKTTGALAGRVLRKK